MKLFSLLNPQYHRFFDVRIAKEIGLNEALLLQELIYKHDYWEEQGKLELDGSFFVTQEDIENDTTLSPYQQTQAIKTLVSKGLISVNKHGMPPVNYYKVSESTFSSFLGNIDQVSKSTLAKKLVGDDNYFEADMYFLQDGIYEFDITKIKDAHDWCYNKIEEKMKNSIREIAVSNTFTRNWEFQKYQSLARKYNYTIFEIICHNEFENEHNVPENIVKNMKDRFEFK